MAHPHRPTRMPTAALVAAALAGGAALAACTAARAPEPAPLVPAWRPADLPAPPAGLPRRMVRAASWCGDRWYLAGAVGDAAGATRPAAWSSVDGRSWRALPLAPRTYYGRQHVLYTVACRDGRPAVLGAKSGGAHGNPRTSNWAPGAAGTLTEVVSGFELYGGPTAVNVARVVAGPAGYLIAGNRMSGAAVWRSGDGGEFRITERAPGLASDGEGETWAHDAAAVPAGWLVVGGIVRRGRTERDPLAWLAPADGAAWRRVPVPGGGEFDELHRVVVAGDTPVAVGPDGSSFAAWQAGQGGEGWRRAGRFGALPAGGVPAVTALVGGASGLVAAVGDQHLTALWQSADRGGTWRPVQSPAALRACGDCAVTLAAGPGGLLLTADDGSRTSVWTAPDVSVAR
ncbi:MAG TPA: hypothetical protein VFY17_09085 [Pilimelia sp.]|nr:hypothetical protein [Pilimelia sp.]